MALPKFLRNGNRYNVTFKQMNKTVTFFSSFKFICLHFKTVSQRTFSLKNTLYTGQYIEKNEKFQIEGGHLLLVDSSVLAQYFSGFGFTLV